MNRFVARAALVITFCACACGGSHQTATGSTGTPNGADGGSSTPPPAPAPDGGSAGGGSPDGGSPTFALGVAIQGRGLVTSNPGGIECPPTCVGQFAAGENIVLNAAPSPGWSFSGFRGACFGPVCTVSKVSSTQSVEAVFTQDPPPSGVSSYTIVEVPPVVGASGGTFASLSPAGINLLGQVVGGFDDCVSVGLSECASGPFSGFLFDKAKGTTVRIADPAASDHTARGINDAGDIILNGNPFGLIDGVVLSNGKATLFGEDTQVVAINAKGWVSGVKEGPDGQFAFLWDGTTIRQIGPPRSFGMGLNDSAVVIGFVTVGGRPHASVFAGGTVQDLGSLPGDVQSIASAINGNGRVVGSSSDGSVRGRGFVFDLPDGPMRAVDADGPSSLSSVNASGDAVGSVFSLGSPVRAILWRDGAVVDLTRALNDPRWQLLSATAINDKGQITGLGVDDGAGRGYVLTPK